MNKNFRRIGQGFCGTVWAAPTGSEKGCAIKREDGGPGRSLYNDYIMHQRVFNSLSASQFGICVPGCHQYIYSADRAWWDERILRFSKNFQVPCNVLLTDQIPPLPKTARGNIINKYCPESLKSSIRLSEPDQDCLIRPYLGRRRRLVRQSRFQAFSLRNYPLHLDQIEELALDKISYARIMAETLANLYWKAHIDANDVEFVLAPPNDHIIQSERHWTHDTILKSHVLGEHMVWILDFDCCKHMPLDEEGVEQAVKAFYKNDPFYPRPGRDGVEDQRLWDEFKYRFLEASLAILGQGSPEARLPALWIDLVEHREKAR